MATRSRRRRYNADAEDENVIGKEQEKFKVKFAEQIDYKMQIDEGETKPRETKILNDDPTEGEKQAAFKKKLRKYSNMAVEGNYMQIP